MSQHQLQIKLPISKIRQFCQHHPIQQLSVFGSVLRDDFTETSDVDILVTYLPDVPVTLLDMASQEIILSDLIGRKVDLRTAKELSPYFRDDVLANGQVVYDKTLF